MKNGGGYVKLYRSFSDWGWYDDEVCVRLFIHLLVTVNWEQREWHGMSIMPGQLVTSIEGLSKRLGYSRSTIRRALDKLKSTGELTIQSNNHWTTVTLANWAEYQDTRQPNGQQVNQPPTDQRPTSDRPAATTKEVKKERKNTAIADGVAGVELVWPKWAGTKTKAKWEDFKAYRVSLDKFRYRSTASEQAAINLLGKYYPDGEKCVAGLEEAMGRGWKFPIDPSKQVGANGKPVKAELTKADAERVLADLRAAHNIEPGGVIETHLIPKDVLETLRRA